MVNIAAIEKSMMTADEKTLKEMAGNIGMEIYSRLSPEARQRLSGVHGGTGASLGAIAGRIDTFKTPSTVVTTVKELKDTISELPEAAHVWLAIRVEDIEKILELTKRHHNVEGVNVRVNIDTLEGGETFIHPDLEQIILW